MSVSGVMTDSFLVGWSAGRLANVWLGCSLTRYLVHASVVVTGVSVAAVASPTITQTAV